MRNRVVCREYRIRKIIPQELLGCRGAFRLALEKIRPGGTVAINAIHMSDIPSFPYHLIYGERTLRSVANATYQDGVEFLKLAAEIDIKSTITTYPLEDANQALLDMKHSRINGEGILEI